MIVIQSSDPVQSNLISTDGTFKGGSLNPRQFNYVTWVEDDAYGLGGFWEWMNHGLMGVATDGPQRVSRSRILPKVAALPYTYYLVVEYPNK